MSGTDLLGDFHKALGQALTEWQVVEGNLFTVFHRLMASKRKGVTSACYHAVTALEARLSMTDEVAHLALASSPALLERWIDLKSKISRKKGLRNSLAHGELGFCRRNNRPVPFLTVKRYDVVATKKYKGKPHTTPKLSTKQILRYRNDFFALHQELAMFAASISEPSPSPGKQL
jgi:hypothetical protein